VAMVIALVLFLGLPLLFLAIAGFHGDGWD
jgi:hypothetical protein